MSRQAGGKKGVFRKYFKIRVKVLYRPRKSLENGIFFTRKRLGDSVAQKWDHWFISVRQLFT